MINSIRSLKQNQRAMVTLSFLCMVHCIVTPLIVLMVPFLGAIFDNHFLEAGILLISILIGSVIVYNGYCNHKNAHVLTLFTIGVSFWIIHTLMDSFHVHHFKWFVFLIGSAFVGISYYINHKLLNCCTSCTK